MRRSIHIVVLGLTTAALSACDVDSVAPEDASERYGALYGDDAGPGAEGEHGPRGMHGPPAMALLGAAMHGETLTDAQLDALGDSIEAIEAAHESERVQHEVLRETVAAAVSAGALSTGDVGEELDGLETAAGDTALAMQDAIDELHAMLSTEQREALLEEVAAHGGPRGPGGPGGPGGEGPPDGESRGGPEGTGGPGGPPPDHASGGPDGGKGPPRGDRPSMGRHLAMALGLSDDQIAELQDALPEPEAPPAPPEDDPLAGFAEDGFAAADLEIAERHPGHVRGQAERFVTMVGALLPIIDEDQYATLVALLEAGPQGEPRGG